MCDYSIVAIHIAVDTLSLGQLAAAVGAQPRWVLNALTRLGVRRRTYDEALARRLALSRQLAEATHMPLPGAFAAAGVILRDTDPHGTWSMESPDGAVRIAVDLPRFYATYLPRLALARTHHEEKPRGRRPARRGTAVARAQAWGWDTTLLESALARSLEQRMEQAADNMAFASTLRKRALGR